MPRRHEASSLDGFLGMVKWDSGRRASAAAAAAAAAGAAAGHSGVDSAAAPAAPAAPATTVIVLRGVPGSGKTTWAKRHMATHRSCVCVSADTFMVGPEGEYQFNPTRLAEVHGKCWRAFLQALAAAPRFVVVDNTNIQRRHFQHYLRAATNAGCAVQVVKLAATLAQLPLLRQSHQVPRRTVTRMWHALAREAWAGERQVRVTYVEAVEALKSTETGSRVAAEVTTVGAAM